ncbi:MAG TPA: phage major capsid protein [Bacteroidales bacterium]|nr:phage major capsid protein [Bacteroidales bacterium]
MEIKTVEQLSEQLTTMQANFEAKAKEAADANSKVIKSELEAQIIALKDAQEKISAVPEGIDLKAMEEKLQKTIEGFDKLQARLKGFKMGGGEGGEILSLKEAIGKAMTNVPESEIKSLINNRGGSLSVPLGAVDLSIDWKAAEEEEKMQRKTNMILSNSLTGTTVLTYNQRQAIIPAQKFNLREVTPTIPSPTGQYVTYSEDTGKTNNIAAQTEGSDKGNNVYAFTAATLTNPYIAGFTTFSKQLTKFLPFMQNTLSRMLMRDYFKKENAAGMVVLATGTGPTSMGSSPDDVKQIINLVGGFANTDYTPSFVLINWLLWSRLVTSTYGNGYYAGAGLVVFSNNQLSIGGIPVIPASWVTANKACLVDADYLERVEVEGLNLAFSFENDKNFIQNLITARIECQTAFNLMRTDAVCYADLGAS